MAYTTNAMSLDAAKLQENINALKNRKNLTANEKTRLKEYQQRISEIQSQPSANPPPAAGDPNLNKNVTDAARAAEVAAELQKRVDADKASENERKRLADLQVKFPTAPAVTPPPVVNNPAPVVNNPAPVTNTPAPVGSVVDNVGTGGVANPDDAAAIQRALDIIGVGEDFGRNIGEEFYADGSLGRVAETLTPEEQNALNLVKDFAGTAGNQSQQAADLIAKQQGILDNAQQLSPLELEALGISREALQGLSAPQLEALRSQARANITGTYQSNARQLAKAQANNQVFGASATAQNRLNNQDRVRETRNLERDLLIKDIDIKQQARNDFTNLVTQTENARAGRTNAASGQLSNTITTDEATRKTAQNNANQNYAATSTSLGDRLRQLQEFNLGQSAAEKAGQVGSIFGGIGAISNQRGLLAGEDFANKQFLESQEVQDKIFQIVQDALKKGNSSLTI